MIGSIRDASLLVGGVLQNIDLCGTILSLRTLAYFQILSASLLLPAQKTKSEYALWRRYVFMQEQLSR